MDRQVNHKNMKIAIVSKLWEATEPESTGGTGAVVGYLTEELLRRGHDVTLFASSDSRTGAKLIPGPSSLDFRARYSEPQELANIAAAFDRRHHFDIIHCHNEYKSLFFGAASATPSLHSVRFGEFFADELAVFERYRHLNFVSISQAVKNMLPALNWRGLVYNGLDFNRFQYRKQKQDYLLFLGRLSPQKGPDVAIRVAKKLNKKLILAGKKSAADTSYLQEKVEPFIDGQNIRYLGEVGFMQKVKLLAGAIALLHPAQILEAFGMTLIEAMACGTPVVAFDQGAIKEVIADGQTGFVVKTEDEMIEALGQLDKISALICRKRVEDCFSVEKMVDGYEAIYRDILS